MKKANCNQKPNLKSTSEHTNHQTTPLFFKIALGLVVLLFFPSFTFSQTNLSCNATINPTALVSDYTIPTGINSLTFTIKGGDGGDAYLKGGTCDIRMRGGAGATVTATFEIGTADDQLQAGGTLRVFVGRKGGTEQTRCAPIPVTVTGSGGGSSAILYLPPGKSSTATEWFLLAEAGAGGGGARPLANVFRSGQGGNQSESGRNVGNISGGVVGVRCASGVSSTGKGGQLDCNRSDDRNGGTIVSNTQGLNNYSTAQLQLLDNTAASNTGGTRGNRPEGGDGFSGGGVQGNGGGGGGGFGGGANNTWSQGGGGGSFVNIFFKGNNKEKTGGTDGGGTESDGTASITTTTAPISAQCQDKTVLIFSTTVGISVQDIDNGSSIGCGTGTISLDKSTFTCSDIGDNTVTLTIQEGNNTSSCTSVVSIVDRTLPTARCRNVTVNLDNTGNGTLTAAEVDNGSVDFCGIASRSIDHTSFDCSSPSPQNVTLTVIDNHGNSAICNAIVTIDKPTIPTALCKDHTVQLDATGNGVISITNVDNGSIDVCGNISLSLDKTSFTCADVGNNTVTLTVRTSPSNQATCTSNVTVEDKFAPIIACPNIFATLDQNGTATISPQQLELFALDNCRVVSRSLDQTSFDCSNLGDNDVTITVTDINSNSSTCRVNLKVVDVTEPTARCKDVTVYLDESGAASLSANDIDNDSKDNCGITNRTLSKTSFDCSNVGSNTVTLTLSDKSGNTSNCTSTVTVKDEAKPTALCQNVTVNLDNNGSGILSAAEVNAGSTDNCTIASVSIDKASFNCNSDEVEEVTLTVTDVNGNTSTCTSDVTINTSAVLKAVCRDIDVFVNANGTGFFLENEIDGGSVGCGNLRFSDDRVDVTCADVGTTRTITLVVFDENLNRASCTGIVSIKDEISPQANCKDIELILDGNGMATLTPQRIDNSSNDNCSVTNLSLSKTSFDCSNIGSNTIVLTATDGSGNSSTCTSIVTVADKRPPTAICQNVSVQIGNNNSTDIAAQIGASSVDNCGIASYMLDKTAFTCDDLGDNTVQLIVTDESGNMSSCNAVLTVEQGFDLGAFSTQSIGTTSGTATYDLCSGHYHLESTPIASYNSKVGYGEFAYITLTGDFTFTAELKSFTSNGIGGLMVRESGNANALMAWVGKHRYSMTGGINLNPGDQVISQRRGRASRTTIITVTRTGDLITFKQGRMTLLKVRMAMGTSIQVGMFLSSNNSSEAKASFNNVSYSTTNNTSAIQISNADMSPYERAVSGSSSSEGGEAKVSPLRGLGGGKYTLLQLKTWPNPTRDFVNIEVEAFIGNAAVLNVYDLSGQLMLREDLGMIYQQEHIQDIQSLPAGVYIISLESAGQVAKSKVVVTK